MWSFQTHLDLAEQFPSYMTDNLTEAVVEQFLNRCGENLKSLDISHKTHCLSGSVLHTVGEFKYVCTGFLSKLKLHGYEILLFHLSQTRILLENYRLMVNLTIYG
jgi:hypothetical protein